MTYQPLELVCDQCGYHCCITGILCRNAKNGTACCCTRQEWERRRVEGARTS
jgi:hypothetical protein